PVTNGTRRPVPTRRARGCVGVDPDVVVVVVVVVVGVGSAAVTGVTAAPHRSGDCPSLVTVGQRDCADAPPGGGGSATVRLVPDYRECRLLLRSGGFGGW